MKIQKLLLCINELELFLMVYEDIIGNKKEKTELIQMVKSDRIPHAILLLGPEGSNKLLLALAFAQQLVCKGENPDQAHCTCTACLKSSKFVHPDIHFSFPTIGKDAISDHFIKQWRQAISETPFMNYYQWLQYLSEEVKTGNITVKECIRVFEKLSLKSFESKRKILILWGAEYLGNEGNRLLKLIEEPPENTILILVAENEERILNTILSRCQLIKVKPLSDPEIMEGLLKYSKTTKETANSIAYLANGNFKEALDILNLADLQDEKSQRNVLIDWLRLTYIGNGAELVNWVEAFSKQGRENQKLLLKYALHFLRECLLIKLQPGSTGRLMPEEQETAQRLAKVLNIEQVEQISSLFTDSYYHIERNANGKVVFLDNSIRLHKIFKQ